MPPPSRVDPVALRELLRRERGVVTHAELEAVGLPRSTTSRRQGPAGPWSSPYPGVVITHRGTPTVDERARAALKYAGPAAVLTGVSSLRRLGFRCASPFEHVLVPHARRRVGHPTAVIERTTRPPDTTAVRGIPCASAARALFDACRRHARLDDVRELVAHVIQSGGCTVEAFAAEVAAGARGRSALSRATLAEVAAGVRSVAEAKARTVLGRAGVPAAEWNLDVYAPDGRFLGSADAVWREVGLVVEIDSMAWHLAPAAYRRTQKRQRRLSIAGLVVLPASPGEILQEPDQFVRDVRGGLIEAAARRPPDVVYRKRLA